MCTQQSTNHLLRLTKSHCCRAGISILNRKLRYRIVPTRPLKQYLHPNGFTFTNCFGLSAEFARIQPMQAISCRYQLLFDARSSMNCVSWQDPRHICNNARVTTIALSRRAVHLSPRCITYAHHVHKLAIFANRAHRAPQTMQSSAVMSINTPHTLSNVANPSAASYLAPILHIDSAASSQTPSPNDGTSSIVAHQGQTGAKSCRAITIQFANASEKSPRDSVASCSASLRSLYQTRS